MLLTNVDGLYSDDPRTNPDAANLLATVPNIDQSVTDLAADTKSALGTGGMESKLQGGPARHRRREKPSSWRTVRSTAFSTASSRPSRSARCFCRTGKMFRRGSGGSASPPGRRALFRLDAGARRAVLEQGKSLLPIGVTAVEGEFGKGDVVSHLRRGSGVEIARGLSNYASATAARFAGFTRSGLPGSWEVCRTPNSFTGIIWWFSVRILVGRRLVSDDAE